MEQLPFQDSAFLHLESAAVKTHFTLIAVYDQSTVPGEKLLYRDIVAKLGSIIDTMPIFRRRIQHVPFELDYPYLVDDPKYHIESHLRHIALPAPYDWRQFCILASQIEASHMDLSKPLWDITVVEGLNNVEGVPVGSFALLIRLHHAVADGDTVRGLLAALHQPTNFLPSGSTPYVSQSMPKLPKLAYRAVINNAKRGQTIQKALLKKVPGITGSVGKSLLSKFNKPQDSQSQDQNIKVPFTPFNQALSYRRVFQAVNLPFDEVKALRNAVDGATINDLVSAITAGALKSYLEWEGELPEESLHAVSPVNQREQKFSDQNTFGNNISMMRICLHTDEPDPIKRLGLVMKETRASKKEQSDSSTKELIALSGEIPNAVLASAARIGMPYALNYTKSHALANCVISNIPGPPEALYFMGAEMTLLTGVGPLVPGMGPTIGVISYHGRLIMGIAACPHWIKDPQKLAQCFANSFEELKSAAKSIKSVPATKLAGHQSKPAKTSKPTPKKAAATEPTSEKTP